MVKLADHVNEEVQASECLVWCSIEAASVVDEDWTHQDLRAHHPYLVRQLSVYRTTEYKPTMNYTGRHTRRDLLG